MATIAHRALNGGKAVVRTGPHRDLSAPYSSTARFITGDRHWEVAISNRTDFARDALRSIAQPRAMHFTEEYRFHRGTLRIGIVDQVDDGGTPVGRLCGAAWEGSSYSLLAHIYNGSPLELLALLDKFSLTELPDALLVRPKDAQGVVIDEEASVTKEIPGIGLIDVVQLTSRRARLLPNWKGTRVRGGELFVESADSPRRHFVLVTATAVSTIVPDRGAQLGDVLAELEDHLSVEWVA
jgi:hypothetical protein